MLTDESGMPAAPDAEPETSITANPPIVVATALALAACGGGGGSGGGGTGAAPTPAPTPTPVPSPSPTVITTAQASRFLTQSTMGATRTSMTDVASRGYDGWLTQQFGLARATTHWDWLVANGYNATANINSETGFDPSMWRQLITGEDQLRQRVGMALLDMLVVGIGGVNLNWKQFAMAAYVDVLLDGAFGNYRDLIGKVTFNAAMGSFLTFLNNRKANPSTGAVPDENYARELMQLFTIGLQRLNMDGTVVTAGGQPVETYTLADVSQLARVFTGLVLPSGGTTTPDIYRQPMVMNASRHETGAATVLGSAINMADGTAAINQALDVIFVHSNVPPFVSKQLIQRLVTSNPSPAYVARVSAIFANNGAGVRGDMKAVVRAILLDTEARSDTAIGATSGGKLREPVMRLTAWARAYGATSASNAWAIGDTSSQSTRLAQSMGRSPTVFNFFRPGYSPPGSAISTMGLVAPEFQIANEQSVVAYVNYMYTLISAGTGDVRADYTDILTRAGDSAALVTEVNDVLVAGQLAASTIASIRAAVDSIATTGNGPINRVGTAILLAMASPDFLTVR